MHNWKAHGEGVFHNPKKGKSGGNGFTTRRFQTHSEETKKKIKEKATDRLHSEETKKKISLIRKKYLEENPDKIPYLLNHSSKISFPEQYFLECFSDVLEKKFQHRVHTYLLDFANEKEKLYLEIDGEQHYLDKRMVNHDSKRTKILESLGWKGIRIRWSSFQKMTNDEKSKITLDIKIFMKWSTKS